MLHFSGHFSGLISVLYHYVFSFCLSGAVGYWSEMVSYDSSNIVSYRSKWDMGFPAGEMMWLNFLRRIQIRNKVEWPFSWQPLFFRMMSDNYFTSSIRGYTNCNLTISFKVSNKRFWESISRGVWPENKVMVSKLTSNLQKISGPDVYPPAWRSV